MRILFLLIGGPLFLVGVFAHVYVKIKLRPKDDSGLDDYYWEFEDAHPGLARYNKWSQRTFAVAITGLILLFISLIF